MLGEKEGLELMSSQGTSEGYGRKVTRLLSFTPSFREASVGLYFPARLSYEGPGY